ncbi:MAG: hypothetical protein RIT14_3008, partial [Pseudomonadota bacterium]
MGNSSLGDRIAAIVAEVAPALPLDQRSHENEQVFDQRAPWYEKGSAADIYLSPARLERLAARHLVPDSGPILDLACGTGFMGERLAGLGLGPLTGCDLSQAMLDRAAQKGVYASLIRADLHQPLPLPPASFAAAFCAGAFFAESVAPAALAHVLPLVQPGGWLICDVELLAWQDEGFAAAFAALHKAG